MLEGRVKRNHKDQATNGIWKVIGSHINRRSVMRTLASGAGVAATGFDRPGASATAQAARKTFLLIHGAWHGGWVRRRVSDLLEQQGHKVFSPTLTGLGGKSHLLGNNINMDTHVADIVNVVKWEDLRDVCLVAHSYGGYPSSAALEQIADKVSSIVWVDAFKPENGRRPLDFNPEPARNAIMAARDRGELGRPSPTAAAFLVNEKDRAWVDSKLTPQPMGTLFQPVQLTGGQKGGQESIRCGHRSFPRRLSTMHWRRAKRTNRGPHSRRLMQATT